MSRESIIEFFMKGWFWYEFNRELDIDNLNEEEQEFYDFNLKWLLSKTTDFLIGYRWAANVKDEDYKEYFK